jgi:phage gpG-like protein
MKWYGDQRRAEIDAEMQRRLESCTRHVRNAARILLNIPGTTQAIASFSYMGWETGEDGKRRRVKRKVRKKAKLYGSVVSEPGEAPRKQYGHLRTSVSTEVLKLVGRVGTNLEYGKHLELGTRHMAARPWLRRALNESRAKITAILSKPIK